MSIKIKQFKPNDTEVEPRIIAALNYALTPIVASRDEFYDESYEAFDLGHVLYDSNRDPMSGVILRENFARSFFEIHSLFTRPGTFEFYLDVFRRIWGNDVDVQFVIPGDGRLQINIEALASYLEQFHARRIVDNAYVYDPVIDHEGDKIMFQTSIGIKTQAEIRALMRELSPYGVFVEANLIIT